MNKFEKDFRRSMLEEFRYGEDKLTSGKVLSIARGELQGVLTGDVVKTVEKSSQAVAKIAAGNRVVYGINTGFGPLCTTVISAEKTRLLQQNLIKSHAVGLGDPIPVEIARIMLILKAHALAQGYSGVHKETLERILWHIDNDVIPIVPSQGSVGASGDLAPLAHLFLPLLGLGRVIYRGKETNTGEVLQDFGMDPLDLGPKEGLALINGTQFITAYAVMVIEKLQNLLLHADITGAMILEGLLGSVRPFSPELHELRPHKGCLHVAGVVRNLLHQSEIVESHANCSRVQDPYSLRCIPQVHGASRNAWLHLKEVVEIELNAVTDNPVIFRDDHTISGGNFHGQPLALALDYACLAAAEIGNIADRRIYLSLEGEGPVPKLLVKDTGINSGFMIPQYTTAALVSENKGLCFPASADSIPTSLGQEDHVSMGSISGRKAFQVCENVEKIIGVELFCAAQILDFHAPIKSGKLTQAIHRHVRTKISHIETDRLMHEDMETAIAIVRSKDLVILAAETAAKTKIPWSTPWSSEFDTY